MTITNEHVIYYFIKDNQNSDWHDYECQAYLSIPQRDGKVKMKRLEHILLFMYKDMNKHEVATLTVNYGSGDCYYSRYDTMTKFMEDMSKTNMYDRSPFKLSTNQQYLEFRKMIFEKYQEHPHTDFSRIVPGRTIS